MAEETAVAVETAQVEPSSAPNPSEGAVDSTSTEPIAATEPAQTDPNDPLAALEAAMASEFPADEPGQAQTAEPPAEFAPALQISPFVTSPESLQQAVRAADEVWKVASGQLPASQLLEGMRQANPQAFQNVVANLREYLGVPEGQTSPLEAFKQSNPNEYQQIANYYQQVTGKSIEGAADPRDARLSLLERQVADENERRQTEAWNQQVGTARTKAIDFITSKAKGTFAEGQEKYLFEQCAAKVNIPQEEMVNLLLSGNTQKLEAAYRAVVKDEAERIKVYNKNLVANFRKQKNSVPAPGTGGKPVKGTNPNDIDSPLPGETPVQHALRHWNATKPK